MALSERRELLLVSHHRRDGGDNVPLVDTGGHINLFPSESLKNGGKRVEKNADAEADAEKKRRQYEDQYTMRFSNAAGFKQSVGKSPWYSSSSAHRVLAPDAMPEKDVWGNEDPRRREREAVRLDANDPLAAMKKGVRQLKDVERQRKNWREEKCREIEALKVEERQRRHRHHKRRRQESEDSLKRFKLDSSPRDLERSSQKHLGRDESLSRHKSSRSHSHRYHRHHRERYDDG